MRQMPCPPILFFSACFPLNAQQTRPTPQDPQAISLLNQTLAVRGRVTAIKGVTDYAASGTSTYHEPQDIQTSVTVQGLGLDEFRLVANLPAGRRSWAIQNGKEH